VDWLSTLRYGAGPTDWTATIPARPFGHRRSWLGGQLEVASGSVEAYTVRTDKLLTVTFRVKESELAAFLLALDHGVQNPGALEFFPNGTGDDGFDVYVLSPRHGEDYEPQRSEQMGGASAGSVFECPVTFRKVDGTAWALNYFSP
jgi:hypothetical protein